MGVTQTFKEERKGSGPYEMDGNKGKKKEEYRISDMEKKGTGGEIEGDID
jgi:hypothetical protein